MAELREGECTTILFARGGDFADKLMTIIAGEQMTAADALPFVSQVAGYLLAQCADFERERFVANLDERIAEFRGEPCQS
jgi:hypothetical protein